MHEHFSLAQGLRLGQGGSLIRALFLQGFSQSLLKEAHQFVLWYQPRRERLG